MQEQEHCNNLNESIITLNQTGTFSQGVVYVLIGHAALTLIGFIFLLISSGVISSYTIATKNFVPNILGTLSIFFWGLSFAQSLYAIPMLIYFGLKKQWKTFQGILTTYLITMGIAPIIGFGLCVGTLITTR